MAAPVPDKVILALDTGNTGKQVRTQTRLVGALTVHEHFFVPISPRTKLGIYYYSPAQQSVLAAAQDGTTTAFFWLQNPAASGRNLVLREIVLRFGSAATTVAASAPTVVLQQFTFTGTASGASVTPAKSGRIAAEPAPVAFLRTAVTGMTPTLGAQVAAFQIPAELSGVGHFGSQQVWPHTKDPLEDDGLVIVPGTGVVIYQVVAGTASDPRRFTADIETEEVDV